MPTGGEVCLELPGSCSGPWQSPPRAQAATACGRPGSPRSAHGDCTSVGSSVARTSTASSRCASASTLRARQREAGLACSRLGSRRAEAGRRASSSGRQRRRSKASTAPGADSSALTFSAISLSRCSPGALGLPIWSSRTCPSTPAPQRTSSSIMPVLQTSTARPQNSPCRSTSGAANGRVPEAVRHMLWPLMMWTMWSKFTSLSTTLSSVSLILKTSGLRPRWQTQRRVWRCARTLASCMMIDAALATDKVRSEPGSSRWRSRWQKHWGPPNSTRNIKCDAEWYAAIIPTMFGCRIAGVLSWRMTSIMRWIAVTSCSSMNCDLSTTLMTSLAPLPVSSMDTVPYAPLPIRGPTGTPATIVGSPAGSWGSMAGMQVRSLWRA
mmetsp:Transcript_3478/g.10791  ORF Transcript_3478/g.10791 Transcript_3478/m.10791 type:complete len:382 (+) Transcript_3478:32-1177(+)